MLVDFPEAKKGKGEANPKRMAALLVEHLEAIQLRELDLAFRSRAA